jgi:glycosidase
MQDFEEMLATAKSLGIKVIMDLVVNHSSNQVPYFQEFSKGPTVGGVANPYWDWYVWSLRTDNSVRVDNSTGSPTGSPWRNLSGLNNLYRYIGIFGSNMPDLNFDNPAVREEMIKVGKFWVEKGVSGYRLDAAKHIFGDFAGTVHSPDIVAKNMAWWKEFRAALQEVDPDVYLIGEIWEEDTSLMLPYVESLQSTFDFKQAIDILAMSNTEKAIPEFTSKLVRLYDDFGKVSDYNFLNCTFLTNHDQNRVMSTLGGNGNHARTAAAILLTLPGNPFIYYGEEVGLTGMKPDQNIREPMPWYRNTTVLPLGQYQTRWMAKYNYSQNYARGGDVSVEAQENDPASLLSRYKELIKWRNELKVMSDGDVAIYDSGNESVLSYVRMTHDDRVLVATNLSGAPVTITLDQKKAFAPFTSILKKFALDTTSSITGNELTIAPYSTVVLQGGTAEPSLYLIVSENANPISGFNANILVNAMPYGFVPTEPVIVSLIDSNGKTIGSGVADSNGDAVVNSPKMPYSGKYTLKAVSGGVTAECQLTAIPKPQDSFWIPTLSSSGNNNNSGGTYIKFGAVPRDLVNCLNFDGDIKINGETVTTQTFVYKADNATFDECCRVYIPRTRNSLNGAEIVIKNVVFKDMFPSYSFTFTINVPQ